MRDQEIIGLHEAYLSVYSQPQELTEEVEIAAQYFYEMGLNEDGIDILIEELGVEEFVEFVYDIAEEYLLAESRAGGVKIEPKLSSGKPIQGKPKAASLKSLRKKKAERAASEEKASAEKPSGLKASLQRQSAIANAKKQQPKKKGILDRVAGAVNRGIERHNAAMGELKKMKAATDVTVGKVKKAAGEFKKGFTSEEVELIERMRGDEGWEENPRNREVRRHNLSLGYTASGRSRSKTQQKSSTSARDSLKAKGNVPKKDGKDMFEHILDHLVAEGYADNDKAALTIMANMSEGWKQSIMESMASRERLKELGLDKKKPLPPTPPRKPGAPIGPTYHGDSRQPIT